MNETSYCKVEKQIHANPIVNVYYKFIRTIFYYT